MLILEMKNAIFFDFFQNIAILGRMVNIGFLKAFWGPKGRFPAKYHISGHYRTKYRFSKNRDFFDFLMIFVIFPTRLVAGIGRKWPDTQKIFKNVFFGLFRSIFIPITLNQHNQIPIYDHLIFARFWQFSSIFSFVGILKGFQYKI